ncbi:MAG: DUF3086 domain-containing protein [Pseudanabaenales cyanobacterium]|nr:DUF3086 domain-containing protein [Pseudanabaenales cyanobacterium]
MSSDDFSSVESSVKPTVDVANSAIESAAAAKTTAVSELESRIASLQKQEKDLKQRVEDLQASYSRSLQDQTQTVQADLGRLIKQGLLELERRKQALQTDLEQLERRQERIRAEMRTSFAGVSQDLAIRVQGFKDYLVGSLQDLASAAEQLELTSPEADRPPARAAEAIAASADQAAPAPAFAAQRFQEQTERIRSLLDQYRLRPDYYGPVWQLRRTFEPVHAEKISNWFFTQGGRGAVKSMGSRLQNVLIASTGISVLRTLYGDRLRTLILANTPERLGEWRRGLQDCLGISRLDFGSDRGLVLFEAPEPLAQRADRLLDREQLPFIIIDESEDKINLSLLQFPLWLAFAPDPMNPPADYDYY